MEQLTNLVLVHIASSIAVATLPDQCRTSSLDTTVAEFDAITVNEARDLVSLAKERPLEAPMRTIVIQTRLFSEVVQNTLLKILEEPPATTKIHLIVPRVGILLPTVRSRVQIVSGDAEAVVHDEVVISFLTSAPADRLQQIAAWHKAENEQAGRDVLQAIAHWVSEHAEATTLELRQTLQQVESWYQFPGASRKMLLEELALVTPVLPEKEAKTA